MDLSIVIPVYNEVESITPLLDEISAQFDAVTGYEIIVVDDGSIDGTAAVLQAARLVAQRHPRVQFVFVGSGVDLESLQRQTAEYGLDNVRFLGRRPMAEVAPILRLADAPELRKQMGRAARQRVERDYSYSAFKMRTTQVLERLRLPD